MNRRQEGQEEGNSTCTNCRSVKEVNRRIAVKNPLKSLRNLVSDVLRSVCGRVSPDRRVIVIVIMFVAFAALNFWMTTRAILSICGCTTEKRIEIPAMERPAFIPEYGASP